MQANNNAPGLVEVGVIAIMPYGCGLTGVSVRVTNTSVTDDDRLKQARFHEPTAIVNVLLLLSLL